MENTSQGNLSFLLEKGKNKPWSEISPRGRIPYIRMRRWLDSPEEQRETMKQLYKTKGENILYKYKQSIQLWKLRKRNFTLIDIREKWDRLERGTLVFTLFDFYSL